MSTETTGIEMIAKERQEQIFKHGRTVEQDVLQNKRGQLIEAVRQLIRPENERDGIERTFNAEGYSPPINWDVKIFDKMMSKSRVERLVIAAALLAAEIDRLNNPQTSNNYEPR